MGAHAIVEGLQRDFPNVLTLHVRLPVLADVTTPVSFVFPQAIVEGLLRDFPNVLTLRVRMPIVADMTYPRNFITKIIKYDKVIDIPNSMTVLPELLPYSLEMVSTSSTSGSAWTQRSVGAEVARGRETHVANKAYGLRAIEDPPYGHR